MRTKDNRSTESRISSRSASRLTRAAGTALALVVASGTLATPRIAHAEEVSPTGKGIAGTALLGAEVVVFAEAIFGVRSGTAYVVGAAGGAVAGGVGGYFIEQAVPDGRIPAYLLAGGLALAIPALVVALDATRFRPQEGARDDKAATMPASDPGKPGGSAVIGAEPAAAPAPAAPAPAAPAPGTPATPAGGGTGGTPAPTSLLDVHTGTFRMGLPLPEVRPMFSVAERKALAVQSVGSELRFPVVRVTF